MISEVWYAMGGWDLAEEQPADGAVMLERCSTLAEALASLVDYQYLAPCEYGPGELVILANDGERLAEPHPCRLMIAAE